MSKHRRRVQRTFQQSRRRYEPAWDPDYVAPPVERAPRYVPDDWQNAWATTTDDVCTAVWRAHAYKLHPLNPQARDDLWDWLWVKACEFANAFKPKVIPDAQEHWAACLRGKLNAIVRWHWAEYYGATAYDDREGQHHVASIGSMDALTERAGNAAVMHIHGERTTMWASRPISPESFVTMMETAAEHADGTSFVRKPAGTCIEAGCWQPVEGSSDMCSTHKIRQRRLWGGADGAACTIEGCPNPAYAKGLCSTHYQADRRDNPNRARCIQPGCDKAAVTRQMCTTHYDARRRAKVELPPKVQATGICTVEGCTNQANGICGTHRYRLAQHGSTGAPAPKPTTCTAEDCDRDVVAKGLCRRHYQAQWRAQREHAS